MATLSSGESVPVHDNPRSLLAGILLILLGCSGALCAQSDGESLELRVTAGVAKVFFDEPATTVLGASVRMPITERLSFAPEVLHSRVFDFELWTVVPNLVYALTDPHRTRSFFVQSGVGWGRSVDHSIDYATQGLVFTAGLGLRVRLGRISLEPRAGLGHGFHAAMTLGYSLK